MRSLVNAKGRPTLPRYLKLRVYKAALDAHQSLQIGKGMSGNAMAREIRYTDLARAKEDLRRLLAVIAKADETRSRAVRAQMLRSALNIIPEVYINLRCLTDLHYMTEKRWADSTMKLESVRSQLEAWIHFTDNERALQEAGTPLPDSKIEMFFDS